MAINRVVFALNALVLTASIVFGGATRTGFLGDVVIQLLAIPLLLVGAWVWLDRTQPAPEIGRLSLLPVAVVLTASAAFLLQLIPASSNFRTSIDAYAVSISGLELAGHHTGWKSFSLVTAETWASAASLIVPVAIFSSVVFLDTKARLILFRLVLGLGGLSLLIGFLQVAQGSESSLRFYEFTNKNEAVGFFANRNHFAALLYVTLVFSAVWFAKATKASLQVGAINTYAILQFAAALAFVIAVVAGLAMARSRAGVFLAMVALVGVLVIAAFSQYNPSTNESKVNSLAKRIWLAAIGFAVLFAAQFGLSRILTRFDRDPLEDLRIPLASTTFEAAFQSLPFGAGIGSFVPVYALYEKTSDVFSGYANRAHNDYAELLLETGIIGLILVGTFMIWFVIKAYRAWFNINSNDPSNHLLLQRAATVVIVLLLSHSFVDYPLRTASLSAVFSFCCALLVRPTSRTHSQQHSEAPHNSTTKSPHETQRPHSAQPVQYEKWGSDVEWPESWKSPNSSHTNDRNK